METSVLLEKDCLLLLKKAILHTIDGIDEFLHSSIPKPLNLQDGVGIL